jgi:hypothetical protein
VRIGHENPYKGTVHIRCRQRHGSQVDTFATLSVDRIETMRRFAPLLATSADSSPKDEHNPMALTTTKSSAYPRCDPSRSRRPIASSP